MSTAILGLTYKAIESIGDGLIVGTNERQLLSTEVVSLGKQRIMSFQHLKYST
jgi:hypothetical protein